MVGDDAGSDRNIIVRAEEPGDAAAIRSVTQAAFATASHGAGTEADIIDALRHSGDLLLSLVAVDQEVIVGQITFSPVSIDNASGDWVGLGPVSVMARLQRTGIGSALINAGLNKIKQRGASGCVLVGNPDYYARFGFIGDCGLRYAGLDSRYVQQLSFGRDQASGELKYCPAFESAG